MKILVISDTHDNISAIKHVLGFARAQNMEAIIHCGDWNNVESVKVVLDFDLPLYTVTGNADEARAGQIWSLLKRVNAKPGAVLRLAKQDVLEFELDSRKIVIAHKPHDLTEQVRSGEFDAVFHGHFHTKAGVKSYGKTLVVNPGALGKTTKPSFAVYDTDTNTAELIKILI